MNHEPSSETIDDENPEWTEEEIRQAIPFSALPESLRAKLTFRTPDSQNQSGMELITLRLSREVIDEFRATGNGWQSRMNAALKNWLKDHRPSLSE